jgi:tetratricopeptide (TPR) repeat protein
MSLCVIRRKNNCVYERLGDVRSKAVTMGQIADILQARGQLDEALRIRKEEIYFRLRAPGRRAEKAFETWQNLVLPIYEKQGNVSSAAVTQGKLADILEARGQLDEALRIRREYELPVFERLGDVRERAITQVKIAMLLLRMALRRHEAESLLREAHVTLAGMGLPEAKQVSELMRQHGVWP